MVRYWDEQIDRAIKITKYRIKHAEKHGMGAMAINEKQILQKQERQLQLRKLKYKT